MKPICKLLIRLVLVCLVGLCVPPNARPQEQPVRATHTMVASVNELASKAGSEIMQQGGSAIDASVATGFALAVVHPQAGNIGGGGFMLLRLANGEVHFLDYREKAPAAATTNMYLDARGNVIADASLIGYKAIGVPGSVAGLAYAQKKWGHLPLSTVMAPAIKLAKDGFTLGVSEATDLREEHLAEFPESKRVFQTDAARGGKFYEAGDTLRQPELAATLERIARNPDDFYHGKLAQELAAAIQKGGGLVSEKDLADYEVKERPVLQGRYRGFDILSAPPPSSGGIVMLEALNILEALPLHEMGNRTADSIHWTVEAFRRAYMDRAKYLGDPDFADLPVAQLIDKKYAAAWRASIHPKDASPSADLKAPAFEGLERNAKLQWPARHESDETTHYSVVDAEGNAVAVTTTLNDEFGSRVTATGLGFLLNDEMDDFTSKPGAPNFYGLIQGPQNAIAPGKRPLSSMMPTIVLNHGTLFLVLGSPGGARIISTVANILMGVIDYGLDVQQAVDAPRYHHQWMPDVIRLEKPGFTPKFVKQLRDRGYQVEWAEPWSDGECIMIDPATGERLGASDSRHGGKAVGY